MHPTAPPTTVILCAVDSSSHAPYVLQRAFDVANRQGPGTHLHLLRIVDMRPGRFRPSFDHERDIDQQHEGLRTLAQEAASVFAQAESDLAVRLHTRMGIPVEEILFLAEEIRADLICIGRHGSERRSRFREGSVPQKLIPLAPCTVIVFQIASYESRTSAPEQCADCVDTRAVSRGEHWFCSAHRSSHPFRSTTLITGSGISLSPGTFG